MYTFVKGKGWVPETQSPVPIVHLIGRAGIRYECRNQMYGQDWIRVRFGESFSNLDYAIESVNRDARSRALEQERGWEYRIAVYE